LKKYYIVNRLFLISVIFTILQIYAKYDGFAVYYFSGRQPSARAEAMGKGYVAVAGDIYSTFYNPAGLCEINGLMFNASYATPFYLLEDATYSFLGIGYKFNRYFIIGLNRWHYNEGLEVSYYDENDNFISFFPNISTYSLTIGSEPLEDFQIGINTNIFFEQVLYYETARTVYFDFGVIKKFSLFNNDLSKHKLNLAGSIINFNHSNYKREFDFIGREFEIEQDLPVIVRLGCAYEFTLNNSLSSSNPKTLGFLLHTEYQDMLNYNYRTALRFGMELSFLEILFLRSGYYNESVNDLGNPESNKDKLSDFTYGLGIQFPFIKLSNKYKRFNIRIDFTSMPQVSYRKGGHDGDNFININLLINYIF
jgi:hypothetical protein